MDKRLYNNETKFGGWSNRATQRLVLWIDNDYDSYHDVTDICKNGVRNGYTYTDVSEHIEDWLYHKLGDDDKKMYGYFRSVISNHFQDVNFVEIAHVKMGDVIDDVAKGVSL
tara:strand:- start:172 stop:507 length:336 start_codon:yes stop_codon:yes gene_type:complete